MLVLWLLELHLTELNETRSALESSSSSAGVTTTTTPSGSVSQQKRRESEVARDRQLRDRFRFFLGRPAVVVSCCFRRRQRPR